MSGEYACANITILELGCSALQTRATLGSGFRSSERLRAPMGPLLGRGGSLGDGGPEKIAAIAIKNTPGRYNGQNLTNPFLHAERRSTRLRLER